MKSIYKNAAVLLPLLSIAALGATRCFAADSPTPAKDIFAGLNGNSHETPYQVLEALYNSGRPTRMAEFPTYEDCQKSPSTFKPLKFIKPVIATTEKEDLSVEDGYAFVIHNVQIKAGEAQPAKDGGPLFPISPAIPANDMTIPNVFVRALADYSGDCGTDQASEELKASLAKTAYSFGDTIEGVVQSNAGTDDVEAQTDVFHSADGVIVEKVVETVKNDDGQTVNVVGYLYLWQ